MNKNVNRIIKGLEILAMYECCAVSTEHDILYAGPDGQEVTKSHAFALIDLGWRFDEDCSCWSIYTYR